MLAKNFLTRAGTVAALAAALVTTAAPNVAYARHGSGAGIAFGILGGVLAGAAIASATNPYYGGYGNAPQVYYAPRPSYYYGPGDTYYAQQRAYYQPAPYGYAGYGYYR